MRRVEHIHKRRGTAVYNYIIPELRICLLRLYEFFIKIIGGFCKYKRKSAPEKFFDLIRADKCRGQAAVCSMYYKCESGRSNRRRALIIH